MADTGLKVGLACLSGAYLMVNIATLYWLVSQQKKRMKAKDQKEANRDHFYDKHQKVIDLTCLMGLNGEDAKRALLDDKFKTPISERILDVLAQRDEPDYQKVFLTRKTLKASYDDLMMIEASLKDKNIPHLMTIRRNPVCSKGNTQFSDYASAKEGYTYKGHIHADLRRHILAQRNLGFVRQ